MKDKGLYICDACGKKYSTKQNLKGHHIRQPLCLKWIKMNNKIKDGIDKIMEDKIYGNDKNFECPACHKIYSTNTNLNKHKKSSKICRKWIKYLEISPVLENDINIYEKHDMLQNEEIHNFSKYIPPIEFIKNKKNLIELRKNTKNLNLKWTNENNHHIDSDNYFLDINNSKYHKFIPSDPNEKKLIHIIWNIFLTDREEKITKKMLEKNKIKYIIAILPNKEIYDDNLKDINHIIMEYNKHEPTLDLELFDEQCHEIEKYRRNRDNILIFCNNGYQRSLPFLCHYLTRHHSDEVPNIEKAIDLILPHVDKENYSKNRNNFIESMNKLFLV